MMPLSQADRESIADLLREHADDLREEAEPANAEHAASCDAYADQITAADAAPVGMPEPLTTIEGWALLLVYNQHEDSDLAELVPPAVWDRLLERGLMAQGSDMIGEVSAHLTSLGVTVLQGAMESAVAAEPVFSEGDMQAVQERIFALEGALEWALIWIGDDDPEDGEQRENYAGATRVAWPDEPENWAPEDRAPRPARSPDRAAVVAEALRDLIDVKEGPVAPTHADTNAAWQLARDLVAGSPRSHELVPLGTQERAEAFEESSAHFRAYAEETEARLLETRKALREVLATNHAARAAAHAISGGALVGHARIRAVELHDAAFREQVASELRAEPLVEGVERTPTPDGPAQCDACDGNGVAPVVLTPDLRTGDPDFRYTEEPCERCAGHGTVGVTQPGEDPTECPECGGAGKTTGDGSGWDGASYHHPPCEVCGDRGELPDCSCTASEASMMGCPIHGEDASEETLAAWEAAHAPSGPSGWRNVEYGLMNAVDPSQPGAILCASFSRADVEAMAEEDETIYVRDCSDWRTLDSEPDDPPEPEIPEGHTLVPNEILSEAADSFQARANSAAVRYGSSHPEAQRMAALAETAREALRPGGRPQWPGTGASGQKDQSDG